MPDTESLAPQCPPFLQFLREDQPFISARWIRAPWRAVGHYLRSKLFQYDCWIGGNLLLVRLLL